MATLWVGVNRSKRLPDVTVGNADPGSHFRIAIDDTNGASKAEAKAQLEMLLQKLDTIPHKAP